MAAAAVSSMPAAHRRVDERAERAERRATHRWRRWCGLVAGVAGGEHFDAADGVNGEDDSGGPPMLRQSALAEEVEEMAAKLAGVVDLSRVDWSEGAQEREGKRGAVRRFFFCKSITECVCVSLDQQRTVRIAVLARQHAAPCELIVSTWHGSC